MSDIGAGDNSGLGHELEKQIADAREDLAVIYALRGEIMALLNQYEHLIGTIIEGYFITQQDKSDQFQNWILTRVQTVGKIEIFQDICEVVGIGPDTAPLISQLKNANTTRNEIAHSHVTHDFEQVRESAEDIDWSAFLAHLSVRRSKKGLSNLAIRTQKLENDRDRIASLYLHLMFVSIAIKIRQPDRSAAVILADTYALNPEAAASRPS